jgi:hypothetical protein
MKRRELPRLCWRLSMVAAGFRNRVPEVDPALIATPLESIRGPFFRIN